MNEKLLEELEGFVEAWRDDAACHRASSRPLFNAVAATYDECADEIEAFLHRLACQLPLEPS
jgi:quinol monooxygenase YgiN